MTWRYDRQEKHALRIAAEAGKMYDQLVRYTDTFKEVGKRLDQAQEALIKHSDSLRVDAAILCDVQSRCV